MAQMLVEGERGLIIANEVGGTILITHRIEGGTIIGAIFRRHRRRHRLHHLPKCLATAKMIATMFRYIRSNNTMDLLREAIMVIIMINITTRGTDLKMARRTTVMIRMTITTKITITRIFHSTTIQITRPNRLHRTLPPPPIPATTAIIVPPPNHPPKNNRRTPHRNYPPPNTNGTNNNKPNGTPSNKPNTNGAPNARPNTTPSSPPNALASPKYPRWNKNATC
mmetsp:Transcript_14397/g.30635  ORF Transcript_14397/g.30635 Transcript_14397/m.30635 type:complete len:224 (-) Transcript_14397:244-915(-)